MGGVEEETTSLVELTNPRGGEGRWRHAETSTFSSGQELQADSGPTFKQGKTTQTRRHSREPLWFCVEF